MEVCLLRAGEGLFAERAEEEMERGLAERHSFSAVRVDSRRDE